MGYDLQILDSYENRRTSTASASIYKQSPRRQAMRPQASELYDIVWTAPRFNTDGSLKSPARSPCCTTACSYDDYALKATRRTSASRSTSPMAPLRSSCSRTAIRARRSAFGISGCGS